MLYFGLKYVCLSIRKTHGRGTSMFKVYIEESALTEPQPMEVSPDAPVAHLVPALVDELQLPRTDLFGNRLVYFLRHADDGRVLPDHFSLRAAGVIDEDCLALESYVAEGEPVPVAPPKQVTGQTPAFYADQTIADSSAFVGVGSQALPPLPPPPLPPSPLPIRRGGRIWTRRALLMTGGAALGLAGIGLAYAGLRVLAGNQGLNGMMQMPQARSTVPARATSKGTPAQTFVPAHAKAQFVFKQHQQTVRALAWSLDGTMLASGGNDQQLLIWNPGGQVLVNKGQNAAIRALTWSPGGHHLAIAVDTQVIFLNAQNGMVEGTSGNTHAGMVMAVAWAAQKNAHALVSAGLDKLAVVWNTQNFQPMTIFRLHTSGILATGWADDAQTIGSSSIGGVTRIWNGASGQQVHGDYVEQNAGTGVELDALAFQ